MWNDKLQACDYLEDINFQQLYGSDVRQDLGNASEFYKLNHVDVLGELQTYVLQLPWWAHIWLSLTKLVPRIL